MINQYGMEYAGKEYDRARNAILMDIVEYVVKKYPSDKKLQESYNDWAIQYIVQSRKLFTPFMEKFMEKDPFWESPNPPPRDANGEFLNPFSA
jgi:hypothetical protein